MAYYYIGSVGKTDCLLYDGGAMPPPLHMVSLFRATSQKTNTAMLVFGIAADGEVPAVVIRDDYKGDFGEHVYSQGVADDAPNIIRIALEGRSKSSDTISKYTVVSGEKNGKQLVTVEGGGDDCISGQEAVAFIHRTKSTSPWDRVNAVAVIDA